MFVGVYLFQFFWWPGAWFLTCSPNVTFSHDIHGHPKTQRKHLQVCLLASCIQERMLVNYGFMHACMWDRFEFLSEWLAHWRITRFLVQYKTHIHVCYFFFSLILMLITNHLQIHRSKYQILLEPTIHGARCYKF